MPMFRSCRRQLLYMANFPKPAVAVLICLLIAVLLVSLYRHDDPSRFPVDTVEDKDAHFAHPGLSKLKSSTNRHPQPGQEQPGTHAELSSKCTPKTPQQLLLDSSKNRQSMFSQAKFTAPNFFLNMNSKEYRFHSDEDVKKPRIVYLHHNKAGGTSIKTCMRRIAQHLGMTVTKAVTGFRRQQMEKPAATSKQLAASSFDLIYGGYTAGLCSEELYASSRPCLSFTLLRDPVHRLVSSYMYCQRNQKDQLCGSWLVNASSVTLSHWAQHQSGFLLAQLSYIPADCKASPSSKLPCWYQMVQAIKKRSCGQEDLVTLAKWVAEWLPDTFAAIGMLDEMELSMKMWGKASALPFENLCTGQESISLNENTVTAAEDTKSKLIQLATSDPSIQRALKLDTILYERAREIFNKQATIMKEKFMPINNG
ncbi:uncharacterized protein LOC135822704 [Sycon ciliatum]|uniref:uncharacterized protein LOC135822704 n=1 Tax=Sycon ciliatum TaxID=27933 RepID=UPI0031F69A73